MIKQITQSNLSLLVIDVEVFNRVFKQQTRQISNNIGTHTHILGYRQFIQV